jgi:phosphoserine phosphatase
MGTESQLSRQDLETILTVTRALAGPFDLSAMLEEVVAAARNVLRAERCSIWLYEPETNALVVRVSSDLSGVRLPIGQGLVGACARDRTLINVPDCYADPRFDASIDRRSGFRTRCALTLPLVDHRADLVGVLQLINKHEGIFAVDDEPLAAALAAECAIALTRARMMEALLESERLKNELDVARLVQRGTLPAVLPTVPGYDVHAEFRPAEQTGGDTFDVARIAQGVLLVLADAAGHGIAPALSITQMHAMLRMAFRFGADLETAFRRVNDQLAATLPDGRFVTAFIGLLDVATHAVRFLSGGQGPILHFRAAQGTCASHTATSFPMGAMPLVDLRPSVTVELAPGDMLVLLSDGVFEYANRQSEQFGRERVEQLLATYHAQATSRIARELLDAARQFADGAPQQDDVTMVIVKRQP